MTIRKYKKMDRSKLVPSNIPRDYLEFYCYGHGRNKVLDCKYFTDKDCPNECNFAIEIQTPRPFTKTGLERFRERYGENWMLIADCENIKQF